MSSGDSSGTQDKGQSDGSDRQPAGLLFRIEAQCIHMRVEIRRAVEAYLLSDDPAFARRFDFDYFQGLHVKAVDPRELAPADLERYAPHWKALVPEDPALRAGLIRLLGQKHRLCWEAAPRIREALGCDTLAVQEAYRRAEGKPLESAFAHGSDEESNRAASASTAESAVFRLEDCLEWIELPGGAVLFHEGEESHCLYVIVSGRLRAVVAGTEAGERALREMSRGEMVGELGVLTGEKRSATIRAIRDSVVLKLPQSALERVMQEYPSALVRINRTIANRLRLSHVASRPKNTLMTFALVPAAAGVPAADFSLRLAEGLAVSGATLHVNRARLESWLGAGVAEAPPDGIEHRRIVAWLSEQESHYRYILYEADPTPSNWTSRCIRQADRVLVLAEASADPTPGEVERQIALAGAEPRAELVLLHGPGTRRSAGASQWLAPRHVQGHYHVRQGDGADLGRLVRRLTGRALGLVLSGGAARGYAHIGVWRALREAGFQIDVVGGTSMGALLGAGYALGWEDDGQMDRLLRDFASFRKVVDVTLPMVSLLASRKVTDILLQVFGDTQIEDLWRPFFCISSNLTRAKLMIHRHGPLWRAVRASFAIPGVFSPVLHEGDVLVDGGVLNNWPVDVMAQEFSQGGPIVAVNISPDRDMVKDYQFGPSVSGWQVLLGRWNPFGKKVTAPSIYETILRTMTVNDVQRARAKRGLADLHIHPPVECYGAFDWDRYPEIIDLGYRAARQVIEEWRRDSAGSGVENS
jgi:lysophospholipid hydrolase